MIDMYRFQYFLSVVPTIYITDDFGRKIIETNQYAVTQQSHPSAGQVGQEVPGTLPYNSILSRQLITGIFFKYDVEPLQLTIIHGHISTYRFFMRLIALVGGVAVCTEWAYKGFEALNQRRERRRGTRNDGLLNGSVEKDG